MDITFTFITQLLARAQIWVTREDHECLPSLPLTSNRTRALKGWNIGDGSPGVPALANSDIEQAGVSVGRRKYGRCLGTTFFLDSASVHNVRVSTIVKRCAPPRRVEWGVMVVAL